MRLYAVLHLQIRKRQVKHVLKTRSGVQPLHFLPIKPHLALQIQIISTLP